MAAGGQLNRAKKVIKNENVILLAIAKGPSSKPGQEIIYSYTSKNPINLPSDWPLLHMLLRIRDEAHRFAIAGHRKKQAKARISSILERIDGVGKKRRAALLKHFGGIQNIKSATLQELTAIPGISLSLAQCIHAALHETRNDNLNQQQRY